MGNLGLISYRALTGSAATLRDWISGFIHARIDMNWPLPDFRQKAPHILWRMGSFFVIPLMGTMSKIMAEWCNTFEVYNRETLYNSIEKRPPGVPLLTISNHNSCLDDPVLWGNLRWSHYFRFNRMRWSLAAHDICFTQMSHAIFFGLGKVVPVVRGNGVYQRAMDFCIDRLNNGEWVHIFPEGKVNMTREFMRIKWGVGRLIAECQNNPIILPMWHVGMDDVLPNVEPYVPKTGNRVTVLIGQPIELGGVVQKLNDENKTDVEKRKTITDMIQEEMKILKDKAERLHFRSINE